MGISGRKPADQLSLKPKNIRNRLRNTEKAREEDLALLAKVDPRWKPVADWDLEELAMGRPRNRSGNFTGPRPSWITPVVLTEVKKRLQSNTFGHVAKNVELAVKVLKGILSDPDVDPRVRLDAAKFTIEHIVGKPTTHVDLSADENVTAFLAGALVLEDGSPAHPVIDLNPDEYEETDEGEDDDDE